jgi:hypothetical protein
MEHGQLGHSEYNDKANPERIDYLDGKRCSWIPLGHAFATALSFIMSFKESEKTVQQISVEKYINLLTSSDNNGTWNVNTETIHRLWANSYHLPTRYGKWVF